MRHIKRLRNGQCDLNTGFAFNDLLTNYDRIAAHCSNIAVAILELDSSNFDMHEYTNSVHISDLIFYSNCAADNAT